MVLRGERLKGVGDSESRNLDRANKLKEWCSRHKAMEKRPQFIRPVCGVCLATALAVFMGCENLRNQHQTSEKVANAITRIYESGGGLGLSDEGWPLAVEKMRSADVTEIKAAWLGGSSRYVCRNQDFECLGVFPNLEAIILGGRFDIDASRGNKIGCKGLRLLCVQSDVSLADLLAFAELRDVAVLQLQGELVSGSSLSNVAAMPNLVELNVVSATGVKDSDLTGLINCKLKKLRLIKCPIGGTGLGVLESMKSLQILDLSGCPVSDIAEPFLARCRGLRKLNLSATDFSTESVERLWKLLPNCDVIFKK